ncbi:FtsX-like permease family protein [Curtobacterium sp. 24E2]
MNGVRSFAPTVLVAALGTTFGSALVIAPGIVTEALGAAGLADLGPVRAILSVVGWLFLGIALYVGAIVTANTCATLIAGQTRIIALQRLVGATGATLRARITRTGLVVGVLGGLIGAVVGTGLSALFVVVLRGNGFLPDTDYTLLPWSSLCRSSPWSWRPGERSQLGPAGCSPSPRSRRCPRASNRATTTSAPAPRARSGPSCSWPAVPRSCSSGSRSARVRRSRCCRLPSAGSCRSPASPSERPS